MKMTRAVITVAALAALSAGCHKSNPPIEGSPNSGTNLASVREQLENAKEIATNSWQQTKEAASDALASAEGSIQTFADYAFDKKDACVARAGADLDALDRKIKELSDKAATASDSVQADAQPKIRSLSDQRAALNQKFAALQNATAANWDETKMDFNKSYDEARASCQQAWQWLTEKMGS